jgi:3-oxo-5-alpha-steroid 4-dehydrogenase 1
VNNLETYIWIWIGLALLLFPIQLFITAPYGRHHSKKWGPEMDNRVGWTLMEIISPLVFSWFFLNGDAEKTWMSWFLFGLWNLHYLNRSFIYPWRTKTTGKKIPFSIVIFAICFNLVNGFFNGYMLGNFSWESPFWLITVAGLILFLSGFYINYKSDSMLIGLRRKTDSSSYQIPKGFLFEKISCPNHFGEILEWLGFALMAWNLAAFSFFIWTFCNLAPRAFSHHKWYLRHFNNYPAERKAVIPFLW